MAVRCRCALTQDLPTAPHAELTLPRRQCAKTLAMRSAGSMVRRWLTCRLPPLSALGHLGAQVNCGRFAPDLNVVDIRGNVDTRLVAWSPVTLMR